MLRPGDPFGFLLGFFLGILGIIVAAVLEGSASMRGAAFGLVVRVLLLGVLVGGNGLPFAQVACGALCLGVVAAVALGLVGFLLKQGEPALPPLEPEPGEEYIVRQVRHRGRRD